VQVTQDVLKHLEPVDDRGGARYDPLDRLEEVPEPLGGDSRFVPFCFVAWCAYVTEMLLELRGRGAHARHEGIREWLLRQWAAVAPKLDALAVRAERAREARFEAIESAVGRAVEHGVRFDLPLFQLLDDPVNASALASTERPALSREPGEMHFQVAALARITRQLAETPAELPRDVSPEVRTKRTLPGAQTAQRDAKVVEGFIVRLVAEPLVRRGRVGEMPECDQAHGSIGWFPEIVDARRHSKEESG
jgi:hypothetical protein